MGIAKDWGSHLIPGDKLLARDTDGEWGKARVIDVDTRAGETLALRVHFIGWSTANDKWIRVGARSMRPCEDSRSLGGPALIGRRVQLQWEEGVWYDARVTRFDTNTQRHSIVFDEDGYEGWYHLEHEQANSLLKWIDGSERAARKGPPAAEPAASKPATPPAPKPPAAAASAPNFFGAGRPLAPKPRPRPDKSGVERPDKSGVEKRRPTISVSGGSSSGWSDEDEQPLSTRFRKADAAETSSEDEQPLSARLRVAEAGRAEAGRAEAGRAEAGRAEAGRAAEPRAAARTRRGEDVLRPGPWRAEEPGRPPPPASLRLALPPQGRAAGMSTGGRGSL